MNLLSYDFYYTVVNEKLSLDSTSTISDDDDDDDEL